MVYLLMVCLCIDGIYFNLLDIYVGINLMLGLLREAPYPRQRQSSISPGSTLRWRKTSITASRLCVAWNVSRGVGGCELVNRIGDDCGTVGGDGGTGVYLCMHLRLFAMCSAVLVYWVCGISESYVSECRG